MKLVWSQVGGYSDDLRKSVITFCKINNYKLSVVDSIEDIIESEIYIIFNDIDLIRFISIQRSKGYKLGSDVGLISFEDSAVKSILSGGLTTIKMHSTEIGHVCADMIINHTLKKRRIPITIIDRNSI